MSYGTEQEIMGQTLQSIVLLPAVVEFMKKRLDALELEVKALKGNGSNLKAFYSIKEAAGILGVSDTTIRRLIDRGLLKASRAIRHIRITLDAIEDYKRKTIL